MPDQTDQAGAQPGADAGAQPAQGQENQNQPTGDLPNGEAAPLDNATLKAHPWVSQLTSELAQLRREKAAREAAEAEAEQKKLQEAGEFEKALQIEKEKAAKAQSDALAARIEAALTRQGAKVTSAFVKVAMGEYDADEHKDDFAAFAEGLAQNEAYAPFFATTAADERTPPTPPGRPPVNGQAGSALTIEQCKALEKSNDPTDRAKARDFLDAYYKEHGRFPY